MITRRILSALRLPLVMLGISTVAAVMSVGLQVRADLTDDRVADLVPYSGTLHKNGVAWDGLVELTFTVYDGIAGPASWSETQSVRVTGGRFAVLLGETGAASAAALRVVIEGADDLYLEVAMRDGAVVHTFPQRQRLTAAPAALVTKAFSDATVRKQLAIRATVTVDTPGTDGALVVHDTSGAVLALDGDDIDATTTLSLNARSRAGVSLGGALHVDGAELQLGGTAGGEVVERVGNVVHIDDTRAFAGGVTIDSPLTLNHEASGLAATVANQSATNYQNLVAALGGGSAYYTCPDNAFIYGGRFSGDINDGKAFYMIQCGRLAVSVK